MLGGLNLREASKMYTYNQAAYHDNMSTLTKPIVTNGSCEYKLGLHHKTLVMLLSNLSNCK